MIAKRNGNGRTGSVKRKGGRRPVEFIKHPDTEEPVEGLRWHKPTNTAYRIEKNRRLYYKRQELKGAAYLRRAIRDHELTLTGRTPGTLETHIPFAVPPEGVVRRIKDAKFFMPKDGKPGGMICDLDDGYCIFLRKDAIYDWVREQIENPETRLDFAQRTVPEIAYLDKLRPSEASLPLTEIADLYFNQRKKKISEKTRLRRKTHYFRIFERCDDIILLAYAPRLIPLDNEYNRCPGRDLRLASARVLFDPNQMQIQVQENASNEAGFKGRFKFNGCDGRDVQSGPRTTNIASRTVSVQESFDVLRPKPDQLSDLDAGKQAVATPAVHGLWADAGDIGNVLGRQ